MYNSHMPTDPNAQTILVVEDEQELRSLIAETLRDAGYSVIEAADGASAIAVARSMHPHLILLDILMPHTDGTAVLKALRQDPWGRDVPVIIFTNYALDDDMTNKLAEFTPAYYLVKSEWSINAVVEKIREVLKNRA